MSEQEHNPHTLPKHVAIIMDGNGRWATARGQDRSYGHIHGAERVPPLVEHCVNLGLKALTLYSFSTENWTREQEEVDTLMSLYVKYLVAQRPLMMENNVRFKQIGRRDGLPQEVLDELDQTTEATQHHTGLTLCLALNYGSRMEMVDATRAIAKQVAQGKLSPEAIDEQTIQQHLYTADLPDPDLLIRTAGEMRLSNYLLWQISYAEFYVADVCWPDFDLPAFDRALAAYANRKRTFGGVL